MRAPAPFRVRRVPSRGFTLIELLVVVSILGLLLGLSMPRLDIPHFAIDASMRQVGSALTTAQQEAVARQHDVIVSFDSARSRLLIHWDLNNDHTRTPDERVRVIPLEQGVVFGRPSVVAARPFGSSALALTPVDGLPALIFRRSGSLSQGGGLYLTSRRALLRTSYASDTRTIELDRATGRTEWFRYAGTTWRRGF